MPSYNFWLLLADANSIVERAILFCISTSKTEMLLLDRNFSTKDYTIPRFSFINLECNDSWILQIQTTLRIYYATLFILYSYIQKHSRSITTAPSNWLSWLKFRKWDNVNVWSDIITLQNNSVLLSRKGGTNTWTMKRKLTKWVYTDKKY